ncbi:unnamed protein product, partial [Staurois parvus]
QSAGFSGALCTECRVQRCAVHRVQGLGVCYTPSAGCRGALHTEGRVQGCAVYRVQGLGVCCVQSARFRGALCNSVQHKKKLSKAGKRESHRLLGNSCAGSC